MNSKQLFEIALGDIRPWQVVSIHIPSYFLYLLIGCWQIHVQPPIRLILIEWQANLYSALSELKKPLGR